MANTTAVYARIDTGLKNNAEEILSKLGITPSAAIQMLYSQIILTGGMPFQPKLPDLKFLPENSHEDPEIVMEFNKRKLNPEDLNDEDKFALKFQLDAVKKSVVNEIPKALSKDCKKIILFGSCARGDYRDDSDVDIAILTNCGKTKNEKNYTIVDKIASDIGLKTMAVVNFALLPYKEFEEKKSWYPFYMNIEKEGVLLYES